MKHISAEELVVWTPVTEPKPKLSRTEKFQRWVGLVRMHHGELNLMHNLEYWSPSQLRTLVRGSGTAMELAASDPVLNADGLKKEASFADIMNYFEITQSQLHEFSCDCGGYIDNKRQADRIADIGNTSNARTSSFR